MNKKLLWEQILSGLSKRIGRQNILVLFKDSIIVECEHQVMKVAFPTFMSHNYYKQKYTALLLQCAQEVLPEVKSIVSEIQGGLKDNDHPDKADLKLVDEDGEKRTHRKVPNKQEVIMEDGIRSKMFNPKYTLSSFIPGNDNRLAHAACLAVGSKPGGIYNPLFLYGGVGLGKTHLLQGTGLEILKNFANKNVVYMTSERFINEIIEAIGKKHTRSFKDRYRKVDCLIVDDIQFFGNKASSQQEFFHTFNELYDAGKQIILSSDRPPRELDQLEDRLKSRFGMGMVVEVVVPDYETRIAILHKKSQELQILVDPEVVEFIAYNVKSSIRELEGILVKVYAESQLTQSTPTIRSVSEAIRKLNHQHQVQDVHFPQDNKQLSVRTSEDVIDLVSSYYKLTKSDLLGEVRRKDIMVPRQVCMFLIRNILDHSYETIGEYFGGRNHTTVLHSCNKILEQLKTDSRILRDVNALKKEIGL